MATEPRPFRRIAADLREAIQSGEYRPGHQLPTGSTLVERYGVARQTVQSAIDLLRAEGLVVSRQGSGWFVAEPRIKYFASLTGSRAKRMEAERSRDTFAQLIEAQGKTARQESTVEQIPADEEIAAHLGVPVGAPVVVRSRVQFADDEPVQLGYSYYPLNIVCYSKIMEPADIAEGTDQILEDLGHIPTRYEDEITARMPTEEEITTLRLFSGTPLHRLLRTTYDQHDKPIEVYIVILPSDRYVLLYNVSAK